MLTQVRKTVPTPTPTFRVMSLATMVVVVWGASRILMSFITSTMTTVVVAIIIILHLIDRSFEDGDQKPRQTVVMVIVGIWMWLMMIESLVMVTIAMRVEGMGIAVVVVVVVCIVCQHCSDCPLMTRTSSLQTMI